MKKADLDEFCNAEHIHDCVHCSDYDYCDNCGRRMCNNIAVELYDPDEEKFEMDELWCRICAKQYGGSMREIREGRMVHHF